MTKGHERPKGIELTFFVAASLLAICFGAKFGCDMRALRAENTALRARLDWWECKQPEQPGSPTLIEDEPVPQEEIDEAVPLTGGLDSLKGVADETEPPLQGSEPPLYGAVGAAAPNARSGKWPAVRNRFIAEHPHCIVCGAKATQVHHKVPFSRDQSKELDETNLRSMCDRCHLLIGHLGNYQNENADMDEHVSILSKAKKRADAERIQRKTTVAP